MLKIKSNSVVVEFGFAEYILNSVLFRSYGYGEASRLQTASFGTVSATYDYVPNSELVGTITFKNGGSTVMTTKKSYDNLTG